MTTAYRSSRPDTIRGLNGRNPGNTPCHGDVETPKLPLRGRLIDQLTAKLRSLHYALSTEKDYRQLILQFVRYHRRGGVRPRSRSF